MWSYDRKNKKISNNFDEQITLNRCYFNLPTIICRLEK